MNITLIQKPDRLLEIIYTACRTCYSGQIIDELWHESTSEKTQKQMLSLVLKVIKSGHLSVVRHINFTFAIDGASRACLNQLVRHTSGFSYSQQSMRYVTFDFENLKKKDVERYYVIPDFETEEQLELYKASCFNSLIQYRKLIQEGVKAEDARGVLGLNFKSNIVATCNLQSLMHLANLRLCTNAQKEIRTLAKEMCNLVTKREAWLKEFLSPKCFQIGICTEMKPCDKYPNIIKTQGSSKNS